LTATESSEQTAAAVDLIKLCDDVHTNLSIKLGRNIAMIVTLRIDECYEKRNGMSSVIAVLDGRTVVADNHTEQSRLVRRIIVVTSLKQGQTLDEMRHHCVDTFNPFHFKQRALSVTRFIVTAF